MNTFAISGYTTAFKAPDVNGKDIVEEVILADCYGLRKMDPAPDFVLDGGACFGAFTLFARSRGAAVRAYEPDPTMFKLLVENCTDYMSNITLHNAALGLVSGRRHLVTLPPGHSYMGPHEGVDVDVVPLTPPPPWAKHSCLKLDVEGIERELFHTGNLGVIEKYKYVVMEWHNYDGALYASILWLLGFETELLGGAQNLWDPTMAGGLLRARRSR